MPAELLAVVEVDYADRVRCQAQGCGHSLHRRIHIVRVDGEKPVVLGSDCCARLFGFERSAYRSAYGGATGRRLTYEEREWLVHNTEALLARLAQQLAQAEESAERASMAEAAEAAQRERSAKAADVAAERDRAPAAGAGQRPPPASSSALTPTSLHTPPHFEYEAGDRPWTVADGERAAKELERARHPRPTAPPARVADLLDEQLRAAMDEVRETMRRSGARNELIARDSYVRAQAEILLKKRSAPPAD